MKKLTAQVALILFIVSLPAHAQSPCQKQTIGQMVNELAEAYEAKALGRLDATRSYPGKVKIVIEHSLLEDTFKIKRFETFEQGEQWLRGREEEDRTPFRALMPLLRCRKGLCTYNFDGGISHNHLYLQKVAYGYRNGCPYIKTIYLYDGD